MSGLAKFPFRFLKWLKDEQVASTGLKPRTKTQLTLRVGSDVLKWYKKQGRGYQTKINLLLRAYMQEHQRQVIK